MTPEQMLENQNLTTELVKQGCRMAADWGAEMVGLGAICAVVGARGVEAAESCSAAVTTGNSLTAYAAFVQFEKIMARLGEDPARHKIVMVGFPGSITLVLTKMLYEKGLSLVLVSRRKTAFLKKFLDGIDGGEGRIEITQDMGEALKQGRIVFSATSSGDIINQNDLLPGSVVFDIAQPKDVVFQQVPRQDVLIVDAGLISLPRATTDQYRYSGWQANDIPSCLGETITLTLEQRWENYSLGRELVIEKIRQIGGLSEKHGFVFDKFR
ncbi:MAG: aspartate aminotransferase family protein, partial [Deltaproteobacteria bacterium]|nr:aspartate aminotransferase family protein [Deltaproteobacteria bacterium]